MATPLAPSSCPERHREGVRQTDMMIPIRRLPLFLGSLALLAACDDPTVTSTAEETTVEPSPSSSSPASRPPTDVVRATEDLAASLEVDPAEVEVVAVEEVTWRNGSRGCAQPGDSYTQALIDGSRITLRVGGTTYEYHSGGSRPPALCKDPTE